MRYTTISRFLVVALFTTFFSRPAIADVVAAAGDASIVHDSGNGTWMLTAGGTTLTLSLDPSRDLAIADLRTSSNVAWIVHGASDTTVRTDRQTAALGSRSAGFVLKNVTADADGDRLQLNAAFDLPSAGLAVTRHYAIVSGSPSFEVWTSFAPGAGVATLADLNAFVLNLTPGQVRWLSGLQGDAADVPVDSAFTLQTGTLAVGDSLTLGAAGRSSEQTVPWFAIDGAQDEFFASIMWSGAWSLHLERSATALTATGGLGPMTTLLRSPIDGPHAVFGLVPGGLAQASAALRSYVLNGIRRGRPLQPVVTYNTWFAYGTSIDDASMRDEMTQAAALGVDLFVVDAGWYAGAGAAGPFDFDAGLGVWRPDPVRFPDGLKPLTDFAHSLGLKFGVWIEPERTNLATLRDAGIDEHWLATHDDDYGSDHAAQICLAGPAAHDWVLTQLTTLIDEVQPDYLKWDNNFWTNCNRAGHGHGLADGNFAHVTALYDILSTLRERYPDLTIENVSGGGNRLDLAMLRYTDVAWMDDRTAPSVHVRHNIEGLSAVFPPAYLLSFVTNDNAEPLHDSPDLPLYFRSRMAGALGLCFRSAELDEADASSITREIAVYKATAVARASAAGALLSAQAASEDGPPWDVIQETSADTSQLLLSAFQIDGGTEKITIRPRGLSPDDTYAVDSVDAGRLGEATGTDLMTAGIDILASPVSAAHVLVITRQP